MKRIALITTFFTLVLASSCSDSVDEMKNSVSYDEISFTFKCGWCVSGKSIVVSKDNKVKYYQTFPCTPEDNIEKERPLTEEEVKGINDIFNMESLLAINLDQCGECYDGCDETLIIKRTNEEDHLIRYDQFDEYDELLEIESLIQTILKIRNSF